MTTGEKRELVSEYADIMSNGPEWAAHIYCWDSMVSVIAQLQRISPENRDPEWVMSSLRERTDYLVEAIPSLKGSPSEHSTRRLVEVIGRAVAGYEAVIRDGGGLLQCLTLCPCLNLSQR